MALRVTETALEGAARVGVVPGPTSSASEAYRASEELGLNLYPWQRHALWVQMETVAGGKLRYPEALALVARQNGKTEILAPRIRADLKLGKRILHTAQNRIIPRAIFHKVADSFPNAKVRYANGQEEVRVPFGGSYMIIAPQKGVRGHSGDTLVIDEVREYRDFDFVGAAEPVLAASSDPQVIYLSNAGDEESIVLNALRQRGLDGSPTLAFLEWSADPALPIDDEEGWLQANPSIGYGNLTLDRLRQIYEKYREQNELAIFETEHLCRWVLSMRPRLVSDTHWQMCRGATSDPERPFVGISVDPGGQRVSVAYAWTQADGRIGLMARDFTGQPIDLTALAVDLVKQVKDSRARNLGFDPWTDQHLARHFPATKPITGQEFANASERFVRAVETGQIRWEHAEAVSSDLPYASRKTAGGISFTADRAKSDRSITAVLAAIRAVWLASNPNTGRPAIY